MANKADKLSTTKRFGARYGKRNKKKLDKIERIHRSRQECPYCLYRQVKRVSLGVWLCRKCGVKFAGRAYSAVLNEKKSTEEEETQ